ncbi:hypothetical protein PoB_007613100 [Plakobranchus ocellatus]|uniref:Uncharacterized protein n=1 Tax=Plakobranchus ocellatus TaxID=259542 RepID=A0AAV4DZY3_9GAST|nr:hypothetical protein PoB_007613100 [Plakobranchus ocellatus]
MIVEYHQYPVLLRIYHYPSLYYERCPSNPDHNYLDPSYPEALQEYNKFYPLGGKQGWGCIGILATFVLMKRGEGWRWEGLEKGRVCEGESGEGWRWEGLEKGRVCGGERGEGWRWEGLEKGRVCKGEMGEERKGEVKEERQGWKGR